MRAIRIGHSAPLLPQAESRIVEILSVIRRMPSLVRRGPQPSALWCVQISFLSQPAMKSLNFKHRGQDSTTDVLSFEAPQIFRTQGVLGDLVLCTAVLKRQAMREKTGLLGELDVLLVHGVLHLLGLDHVLSSPSTVQERRAARSMAQWEIKVLNGLKSSPSRGQVRAKTTVGLIARAGSGTSRE